MSGRGFGRGPGRTGVRQTRHNSRANVPAGRPQQITPTLHDWAEGLDSSSKIENLHNNPVPRPHAVSNSDNSSTGVVRGAIRGEHRSRHGLNTRPSHYGRHQRIEIPSTPKVLRNRTLEEQLQDILRDGHQEIPISEIPESLQRQSLREVNLLARRSQTPTAQLFNNTDITLERTKSWTGSLEESNLRAICYTLAYHLLLCQNRISYNPYLHRSTAERQEAGSTQLRNTISTMATPTLDQFMEALGRVVREKNGTELQNILQLEPPLPPIYQELQAEVRRSYPKGNDSGLANRCDALIPHNDGIGGSWNAFAGLVKQYFSFLRDFNAENMLETHSMLQALLNQTLLALSDSTYGVIVLPTVLYLSRALAKLALGLDKRPELLAHLRRNSVSMDGEGTSEKITLVESSANLVREAFIKCLADKSGTGGLAGIGRQGKPENKRSGIYVTANLCLKLLFQCRKLHNAEQIFVSINAQSPPLSQYPRAQRVTYLYYLGRYLFANNHFYRAQSALQAAYDQCHAQARSQRTLILTYLIASNIVLGRHPSQTLYARVEAQELGQKFQPLCDVISKGDIAAFWKMLGVDSESAQWFLQRQILLQLRNRCEILVWRSLARRVFKVTHSDENKVPFLRLGHIQIAVRWLLWRDVNGSLSNGHAPNGRGHTNWLFMQPSSQRATSEAQSTARVDDDFAGLDEAIAETAFNVYNGTYGEEGQNDATVAQTGPDAPAKEYPGMEEIESIFASLIQQGFLQGYLTHNNPRFAIPGAKTEGPLAKGFPNIWQRIVVRSDDKVPGWVRDKDRGGGLGGGRVVTFSGARPVGSGPF